MTVTIVTLAGGDTDYVSKLNTNFEAIKSAVDVLQVDAESAVASQITAPLALEGILGDNLSLIGVASYLPNPSGSNLIVAPGKAWFGATRIAVGKDDATTLSFTGFTSGTYYLHLQPTGIPYVNTSSTDALYSIDWASGFGTITRIADIAFSHADYVDALSSAALGLSFTSIADRMEAAETLTNSKADGGFTGRSVAGNSNVTLNATEYKKRVLHFTGALTGNITITAPASAGRDWIIANLTTGAFTITFKGSAGSGIGLTQGKRSVVYYDGSEMYRASAEI